jgi:hypothetical protein
VETHVDYCKMALGRLKREARRGATVEIKLFSIQQLFRLLDAFNPQGNAFAPLVYKSLIFALIESAHNNAPVMATII